MNLLGRALAIYSFSLFSLLASEHLPLKVDGLNASFRNPTGSGEVQSFEYPKGSYSETSFNILREEDVLKIFFDGEEIVVDGLSEKIITSESAAVRDLNIDIDNSKAHLRFNYLETLSAQERAEMFGFKMTCFKASDHDDELDELLDACLKNSSLSLNSSVIEEYKGASKIFKGLDLNQEKDTTRIENLKLKITNHKVDFSLRADVTLKGSGRVEYKVEGDQGVIEIRVDKVRAGFFNVTNRFFKISNGTSLPENIKVDPPYIRIFK